MEKEASPPSNPSTAITLSSQSPSPVSIRTPHSPTSVKTDDAEKKQQFIANFSALYRSILPPDSPPMKSVSAPRRPLLLQGSSGSSIDVQISTSGDSSNAFSDADLELEEAEAGFALEYEQLCDRYPCRAQIQDLTNEINALRRENVCLKTELVKQLNLSSKRSLHHNFRRLNLIDSGTDFSGDELSTYSPTSVVEQSRFERDEPERVWLPKSISVRSTNYFKPAANNNASTRMASQLRASKELEAAKVQHRMHLPGAKKELEVYSQGMFKTELCNKWQETGACPYGDHCQFAHGIGELRPVIRHPRYKTEVCRMVMAGDACPYGHRCHFRHSLTEQELMLARAASH